MTRMRRCILGISGGIAAYKAPLLVRILTRNAIEVKTALTGAARPLIGAETLRTLTGNPVFSDEAPAVYDMDHIRLAEWADAFLIAPATANTIAKLAHGIADNLLTTLALSFEGPLLVAPAMNTAMWNKPVTRENVEALKKRGVRVLPVGCGDLACGTAGEGRMIAVETIAELAMLAHVPRLLEFRRVLIASGPTAEPVDAVRVLSNRSSGKMGAALAVAAMAMGAEVTVVSGPAFAPLPEGIVVERVDTAARMQAALEQRFDAADICIMAAAVADYRPACAANGKLDRVENVEPTMPLIANPDIAAALGARKKDQFLVGFSLETDQNLERAQAKMRRKRCDMIIFNRVDQALGGDSTSMTVLYPDAEPEALPEQTKRDAAAAIMLRIAQRTG